MRPHHLRHKPLCILATALLTLNTFAQQPAPAALPDPPTTTEGPAAPAAADPAPGLSAAPPPAAPAQTTPPPAPPASAPATSTASPHHSHVALYVLIGVLLVLGSLGGGFRD